MISRRANLLIEKKTPTKGVTRTNSTYIAGVRRAQMLKIVQATSLFDKISMAVFLIAGVLCLIFIRPFDIALVVSSVSFMIYVVEGNLCARGKTLGMWLSLASNILYIVFCIFTMVWGEVFVNVVIYLPLAIVALVSWSKNKSVQDGDESVIVKKLNLKMWILWILASLGICVASYLVFGTWLGQKFVIFNAISIATGIIGDCIRTSRCKEFWYFYFVSNLATLLMWIFMSVGEGGTLASLPMVLSCIVGIINNVNGYIVWSNLYRKSLVYRGMILNKREVNVSKVIKLKHRFNKMKWKKGS
ncbi:MAG: nicotinamide riboside transporter PnuC [Clostridia bacterium]